MPLGLSAPWLLVPFAALALATTIADLRRLRIPDPVTAALLALGLAGTLGPDGIGLARGVASAAVAFSIALILKLSYRRLRGIDGLGGGDVKLFAALGPWVGPEGLAPTAALAATVAALTVAPTVALGRVDGRTRIPFGPFLVWAGFAVWLARTTGPTFGYGG